MSIIRKNIVRYAVSLTRYFLGGAIAYLTFVANSSQGIQKDALPALFWGALVAGFIGVLKVLQESAQAYLKHRKSKGQF